ncbi:PilT domain-containing protein [Gluconacetobacter sacchari DSM 12717]|uniref:Ribonuclease VapC n=2 Tax=Gluconacetobacter sacchari TaxID=92759 RepID=A0A7W4IHB1_9PROT|nr:type II toxin-antitoxin system VapC family toxin [Gluconacetobacter sacchari]MBB2162739.1 type II toxin-antitoxin system VapC family toxin [Gluconacetobacter sacchari]GBQ27362.1 PilT domain-containing protein [Gluconacetobacter sacchari DSM 12717]
MIVIDTSTLVAILRREDEADEFLHLIAEADRCLLSAVSLLETSMVMAGRTGDEATWRDLDDLIEVAAIEIVPQDVEQARIARNAFLQFGKGRHPAGLNFGDCASYALAVLHDVPLLFKGDDFSQSDILDAKHRPQHIRAD